MPGRSLTRPPRTSTTECSCRLWPSPGMYAVISTPFVSRTRAALRSAEFGFFGVRVKTRVQTPRRCGEPWRAGVFVLSCAALRPLRTRWFTACTGFLLVSQTVEGLPAQKEGRQGQALPTTCGMVANGVESRKRGDQGHQNLLGATRVAALERGESSSQANYSECTSL